jgi:hypothetical protein
MLICFLSRWTRDRSSYYPGESVYTCQSLMLDGGLMAQRPFVQQSATARVAMPQEAPWIGQARGLNLKSMMCIAGRRRISVRFADESRAVAKPDMTRPRHIEISTDMSACDDGSFGAGRDKQSGWLILGPHLLQSVFGCRTPAPIRSGRSRSICRQRLHERIRANGIEPRLRPEADWQHEPPRREIP